MDRSHDGHNSDLRAQVAELRALNAELGRALAAADEGTPLRSSITAALTLSRVQDAEQAAAYARAEHGAAVAERNAAVAERDGAINAIRDLQRALAEHTAAVSRLTHQLTAQSNASEIALAERDTARARLEAASAEVQHLQAMLGRRSVRVAQRCAWVATPLVEAARRLRGRAETSRTETPYQGRRAPEGASVDAG